MFLEHISQTDSLLYPLDTKLLECCIFLLERSGVTDMNSIFLFWLIKLQSDEKSLWYEYWLIWACTTRNPQLEQYQ